MIRLAPEELTGRARTHVVELDAPPCTLHRLAVQPFLELRAAAAAEGLDVHPVSSFRDFERQRTIWNAKFRGERPLLARDGRELDALRLAPSERIEAILLWSALPGASRHHWGSELDVIDRAAVTGEYRPRLVPEEYAAGGPFARLDAWLAANAERFGFFRPYGTDRGGVQPEPWHLSYAPVSQPALREFDGALLERALAEGGVEGLEELRPRLPALLERYVAAIDPPRDPALRLV